LSSKYKKKFTKNGSGINADNVWSQGIHGEGVSIVLIDDGRDF